MLNATMTQVLNRIIKYLQLHFIMYHILYFMYVSLNAAFYYICKREA